MKTKYELFDEAFRGYMSSKTLRKGQATYLAVHDVDSEIADSLNGTVKDCFYIDENIDAFMTEVYTKWGRE